MKKCAICGKEFEGQGHNAEPIKTGICCDDCNHKVIAIRMLTFLVNRTQKVKVGDKIKILSMNGEKNYSDRVGVVEYIDDMGQIHGTWGGCALIPNIDKFVIINE